MHGRRYYTGNPRLDPSNIAPYSWNNFDPRVEEFFHESNRYRTGPGAFLPPEQQPYSIRSNSLLPFRVFIKGIHPHTTEDGIAHVMSNYGNPISVERKRSKFNEVIAFVEYHTQREAENAIISLDGKPPLNWRVSYAYSNRGEDRFIDNLEDLTLEAELESQQLLFPTPGIPARALPSAANQPSSVPVTALPFPSSTESSNFPPCIVCGKSAGMVCTICKTRYCSPRCQSVDWPNHRRVCAPPPPLEVAGPLESMATTNANGAEYSATVPFVHKPMALPISVSAASVHGQLKETANDTAHAFIIKGIHPLDQPKTSNQAAQTNASTAPRASSLRATPLQSPKAFTSKIVSPKSGGLGLNVVSEVSKTVSSAAPPMQPKAPQQARTSVLAAQTSPLSSTMGSHNPTPLPDVKYAKAYPKTHLSFPGNEKRPRVFVCYVESPQEFFVQPASLRNELQHLTRDLQQSALGCDGIANPVEYAPCIAHFKDDGTWYRAQILKIFPGSPTEIGVRFVDFGNKSKMPNIPENLRMLDMKFAELQTVAVKVKLADVLPPNGTTWEPYVNNAFTELILDREFVLEIIRVEESMLTVRLKNLAGLDLSEELIKRGLAKGLVREEISNDLDPKDISPSGPSLLPPPPQVGQKHSASTKPDSPRKPKNGSQQPLPAKATPPREPLNRNDNGRSVTPKATPPNQEIVQPTSAIVSKKCVPSALPTFESDETEATAAELGKLSSPQRPAIQREIIRKIANSILTTLAQGAEATLMVTEAKDNFVVGTVCQEEHFPVLEFHEKVAPIPTPENFLPSVGTVVSAFSEELKNWFRGYILEEREGAYDILYVDYGNVECGIREVKPLLPDYGYPELAVKLFLPENLPKNFIEEIMGVNSMHRIEITGGDGNGCSCALLDDGGIKARLEPWTSLVPREIAFPLWEQGLMSEVLVHSAEDVNKVFVQVATAEAVRNVTLIEQQLLNYLQKFDTIPPPKTASQLESYVAAVFPEDGALYRAKILSLEGNNVTVEFIDYGNVCSVSFDLIRPLPEELYAFPTCGRFVSLSRVPCLSTPLPEAVKAALSVLTGQLCSMFVVSVTDDYAEVVITTKEGCVINERISEALQAIEPTPEMPTLAPASPEKVENSPVDNSLGEFNYEDGPFAEVPVEGSLDVLVLTNDDPRTIMFCLTNEEQLKMLAEMQEEIQIYAESIIRGHSPQVNEICLARAADGFWYRAACLDVLEMEERTMYVCVQVDYGNMIYQDVHNLRRIPKRFVNPLPYLAIQGILKEATQLFESNAPLNEKLRQRLPELLPVKTVVSVTILRAEAGAYIIEIPEIGEKLVSEGLL